MKSYKDLDIYKDSYSLSIQVHELSLKLPKYELYEIGSQVRRSSKSITANIGEGYGRKRYKSDFIRFLVFSHSSCDETIVHLNFIKDLYDDLSNKVKEMITQYSELSKNTYNFIEYVEDKWR